MNLKNKAGRSKDFYYKLNEDPETFGIYIDLNDFYQRIRNILRLDEEEKEALINIDQHKVIYEYVLEISTSHQATIDRILDYLSLEHRKVATKNRKVIKQPLDELIYNYDEFVNFLNKYGWQNLLNNAS